MKQRTVLIVSKGERSSSTRYRALNYFPLFRAHGWNPTHITDDKTFTSHRNILRAAELSDTVVILRRTPNELFGYQLRQSSKRLIFDFDDAIHLPRSGRFSRRPVRFRKMIQRCDHVWAGNSYLVSEALRFNNNVSLAPTAVEIERYQSRKESPTDQHCLVWIGSRSTGKYIANILPILVDAYKRSANFGLKIIADFKLHSETLPIQNIIWSHATETFELADSTIGIAPMTDDAWTRGKCGLKVLQYMASGLPVITSPYGVNRDLVDDGNTGFHAASPNQWIDAIHQLSTNPTLAASMGLAGKRKCQANFTVQKVFTTLLGTLTHANDKYLS